MVNPPRLLEITLWNRNSMEEVLNMMMGNTAKNRPIWPKVSGCDAKREKTKG
jgi:hypothetical protein